MTAHRKISLTVVVAPAVGAIVSAPPILSASEHTIDFVCGNCDAVLLRAEQGQVHNLIIHCTNCGSYNSTNE
jgi:predicted RNA-binding Zn-ribbon protein involved in translation (DUF1610 family)